MKESLTRRQLLSMARDSGLAIALSILVPPPLARAQNPNPDNGFFATDLTTPDTIQPYYKPISVARFSKPILIGAEFSGLYYQIKPETSVITSLDEDNVLTVNPNPYWRLDTDYQFTILGQTVDTENETLGQDFIVNFRTDPYTGY